MTMTEVQFSEKSGIPIGKVREARKGGMKEGADFTFGGRGRVDLTDRGVASLCAVFEVDEAVLEAEKNSPKKKEGGGVLEVSEKEGAGGVEPVARTWVVVKCPLNPYVVLARAEKISSAEKKEAGAREWAGGVEVEGVEVQVTVRSNSLYRPGQRILARPERNGRWEFCGQHPTFVGDPRVLRAR